MEVRARSSTHSRRMAAWLLAFSAAVVCIFLATSSMSQSQSGRAVGGGTRSTAASWSNERALDASVTFRLYHIPEWNLAYCQVSKAASSSMKALLLRLFDSTADLTAQPSLHRVFLSSRHVIQAADMLPADVQRVLTSPDTSRFIVVREPTTRFTSALMQKCVAARKQNAACPRLSGTNVDWNDPGALADSVLDALEAQPPQSENDHWRSLRYFCGLSQHKDQYSIIRLEQLREGLDALAKELHVNETQRAVFRDAVAEFAAENTSPHSTAKLREQFPDWLTPERQARIQRYYAADYELLGYPLPLPIPE